MALAARVSEKVVGGHPSRLGPEVGRAVKVVGAGLDEDARDAALGVSELGVEGRGLHLELLGDVARRDVRGDDLVAVGGRGARRAVNQKVAADAADAVHRVAGDVRRLEGAIQSGAARIGDTGRESDQRVRIAVHERQLRDALLIHSLSQVSVSRVQRSSFGRDGNSLLCAAHLKHDV